MSPARPFRRITQLWQLPLLLFSVALFGYAAILFIDPKPGPTVGERIEFARAYLAADRPDAAIGALNALLREKPDAAHTGKICLLLAESLEAGQKRLRISIGRNHQQIIDFSRQAEEAGIKPDAEFHRRVGESCEALNRPSEAVANYRQARLLEPSKWMGMQRRIIDLQLQMGDHNAAMVSLEEYLKRKEMTDVERAWAAGQTAFILVERGSLTEAKQLLTESLRLCGEDKVAQGTAQYWLGYCVWKLGDCQQAERHLRTSRDLLAVQHPLDADAAYALGKIEQSRGRPASALPFFENVIDSHPDVPIAVMATLNRGVCRLSLGQHDPGLTDLHDVVRRLARHDKAKITFKEESLSGLRQAVTILNQAANYQGSLEVLAYEQELQPDPPATFFARLGEVYERRAEQVNGQPPAGKPAEVARRQQQYRDLLSKSGDAYIAYSRALTMVDDKAYGEAMWKGIQLYNQAGNLQRVIASLELFASERPEDPIAPEALLQLGQAYQAAGLFDQAISAYQRNQFRYPTHLATVKSAVPLAQAYIAKGPEYNSKAEMVLRSVVENNPAVTPQAEEFRTSLFELAMLYYRSGRYEEAIARLEELTQRYPQEQRMGQLSFLIADSYRKSASLLDTRLASARAADAVQQAVNLAEAMQARNERLQRARTLYDKVVEFYRATPPATDIDKLYQKLSHFYRADCVFDLGDYVEAIKLYDAAAFRYQEDPSALAAYVQIVNANCALNRIEEAKAANERAKWLLRRMPPESFADGSFTMPKQYWEQWLKWSAQAGMW